MLKNFKTSRKMHFGILGSIFLLLLVFNIFTGLFADDFTYAYSFATGEKISSISELVDSMRVHGEIMNGRYFSHTIVQIFLLMPGVVFDIVNSLMFVLIIYFAYRMCNLKKKTDNIMLLGIFGCVWLFEHNFGQINLWLDGSINYQFPLLFGLLFIKPFVDSFINGKIFNPFLILPHVLLAFWLGAYIEPVAVGFVASAVFFTALDVFYNKNKKALFFIPSIISALLGFAWVAFTPSHLDKKLTSFSILNLLMMLGMALVMILSISPLIAAYVILLRRAKAENVDKRIIFTAHIFALGALASNFVLVLASYFVLRCTVCFIFMSIMSTAILYGSIENRKFGKKGKICEKIFLIALALAIVVGFADVANTYRVVKQNEKAIEEARLMGKTEVELKCPFVFTKYNAAKGLIYLEEGDGSLWPNPDMAKYYGIDVIKKK